MGSRLSARRALISLVLVGGLTGCGDEPAEQTPTPTMAAATETSPAPEPSPTPTPLATSVPLPVMPPEMANNDAAGAEAAARYFVDLYGYSYLARDVSEFERVSDQNCAFCDTVISEVEQMLVDGEVQEGGLISIDEVLENSYHANVDTHIIDLITSQTPYREVDRSGNTIAENDGAELTISIILQLREEGWVVIEAGSIE